MVYVFCSVPFHSESGKGRYFLFPYSKCMDVDQWYIARLSFFGLASIMVYVFRPNAVSSRIKKKETTPFSLFLIRNAWC